MTPATDLPLSTQPDAGMPGNDVALSADNQDSLYEIVNGHLVEKSMGYYECGIASILGYYLEVFARANQLGRVRVETLFRIKPIRKLDRRPDVAFISFKRWPKGKRLKRADACEIVPDLVVEVISPSNLAEDVLVKIHEYLAAGVEVVWVIYPRSQQVHVFEAADRVHILGPDHELDGGTVLPGFSLPVAALFEDEVEWEPRAQTE